MPTIDEREVLGRLHATWLDYLRALHAGDDVQAEMRLYALQVCFGQLAHSRPDLMEPTPRDLLESARDWEIRWSEASLGGAQSLDALNTEARNLVRALLRVLPSLEPVRRCKNGGVGATRRRPLVERPRKPGGSLSINTMFPDPEGPHAIRDRDGAFLGTIPVPGAPARGKSRPEPARIPVPALKPPKPPKPVRAPGSNLFRLDEAAVRDVLESVARGEPIRSIARRHGITPSSVTWRAFGRRRRCPGP